MEISKITRIEFENWLSKQPKGRVVGKACLDNDCPVSNFLFDFTGNRYSVSPSVAIAQEATHYEPTPPWMEKFVKMIDASPFGKAVTAAQCLQLLRFH